MKKLLFTITWLWIYVIFPLTIFSQTTSGNADLSALDKYFAKTVSEWKVPGAAIAIVRNDSVIFAKGYGVRKMGENDPVDAHTLFAIASNTKAFTAALLAMLVDEQKISWEDPVQKYLTSFQMHDPYVSRELTIRDLLSHRSGLITFGGDLIWYGTTYDRNEVLRRIRYLKPAYSFRSQYGYQNIISVNIPSVKAGIFFKRK